MQPAIEVFLKKEDSSRHIIKSWVRCLKGSWGFRLGWVLLQRLGQTLCSTTLNRDKPLLWSQLVELSLEHVSLGCFAGDFLLIIGGYFCQQIPALATSCDANADLTVWTCTLREGVTFHNGATLDANDVVLSYAAQWDMEHPLHVGRDGNFAYFSALFGGFLNEPEN